jgi:hypothetical protein
MYRWNFAGRTFSATVTDLTINLNGGTASSHCKNFSDLILFHLQVYCLCYGEVLHLAILNSKPIFNLIILPEDENWSSSILPQE